jgi:hypothetical protein
VRVVEDPSELVVVVVVVSDPSLLSVVSVVVVEEEPTPLALVDVVLLVLLVDVLVAGTQTTVPLTVPEPSPCFAQSAGVPVIGCDVDDELQAFPVLV